MRDSGARDRATDKSGSWALRSIKPRRRCTGHLRWKCQNRGMYNPVCMCVHVYVCVHLYLDGLICICGGRGQGCYILFWVFPVVLL